MNSSPKPPKPTDPEAAAAAQARWNRTGQVTPFGSVTWEGNNQVSKPSDEMMALYRQALGQAGTPSERYEAPSGFSEIRDATMTRLSGNQYGHTRPRAEAKPVGKPERGAKGTPFRDVFLGEKDPQTGERRTMRHLMRGGLYGSLGRGIMNMVRERQDRNAGMTPSPLETSLADIGRRGVEPISGGRMPAPVAIGRDRLPIGSNSGGMPGPLALPPPSRSPIEQTPIDGVPRGPMVNGRPMTPEELARLQADPRSLFGDPQQNPMDLIDRGPLSNFVDLSAVTRRGGTSAQQQAQQRALAQIAARGINANMTP